MMGRLTPDRLTAAMERKLMLAYLSAGRALVRLSDDAILKAWVPAYRAFSRSGDAGKVAGLWAEAQLRSLELPTPPKSVTGKVANGLRNDPDSVRLAAAVLLAEAQNPPN